MLCNSYAYIFFILDLNVFRQYVPYLFMGEENKRVDIDTILIEICK